MTVMKYILVVIFQIHWGACILRAIDGVILNGCEPGRVRMRHARGTEECPATILSFYWNQGMWSLYCGAVGWSLATMQGEFMASNIAETVLNRAAQESEISNFKASYLGCFPLVLADFWTSDHLLERSRSVDVFSGTRARGTLTLKRR